MADRSHLLIVDDDREIRTLLSQYLDQHGFRTTAVADAREMRRVLDRGHVDLIVLDLMLPGEDGLSACRELRTRSEVPVIMLRRAVHAPRDPDPQAVRAFSFGGWRLDTARRTLAGKDGEVPLSGAEYRLLAVLLSAGNRVLSRSQLAELLRGREADPFDRSIDVRVSRLRHILGDDARSPRVIKTVYGEGYVIGVPVQTH